jgi:hypothetical protein
VCYTHKVTRITLRQRRKAKPLPTTCHFCFCVLFLFWGILGFELRASCLLGTT